jgi:hypothetical protein
VITLLIGLALHAEPAVRSSFKPDTMMNRAALCAMHAAYLDDALQDMFDEPKDYKHACDVAKQVAKKKFLKPLKACAEWTANDCAEFENKQ